ncbi:MAG: hypothetical protein H6R10_2936 [Rhodocyclaceae bacterium]|nr:hypothetical protein [Rhodocyclaceae bacterium]
MNEKLRILWSSTVFALVLVGIAGLSWSAFQENGWVERLLGVVWDAEVRHPLLLVPTIGGALLMAWLFLRGGMARGGKDSMLSHLWVYGLMASGAYFAVKWIFF